MKKLTALLMAAMLVLPSATGYAYNLPTPDWGALLKEKTAMVMQNDFDLYVEGNEENAPYYGAKFEPRYGAYIGMSADTAEDFLPLGCYLTYIESYYQNDLYYPSNTMVRQGDVITMVGFNTESINNVDYDAVDKVLNMLNNYNKPIFVRFANEMNCSSLGDDPELYVNTFRNVANLIHKYPNLAVVWSPNDIGALDKFFDYYYPGDEYIDWIGVSCYTKKYFNNNPNTSYKDSIYFMTGDFGWATNKVKPIVDFMQKNNINKPLMISEGGVATNNTFGDSYESNELWNTPRMRNMYWNLIMKYPQIKMINYFNISRPYETERYDISDYSYASNIFKEAASSGAYIRSLNGKPEFVYSKAENGNTLKANKGIVNLYTLAYIPQKPNISINYKIDGVWFHSSNTIPYKCHFDVNSVTNGEHTLTIESEGLSKSYTLYRNGDFIRFGGAPVIDVEEETTVISVLVNNNKLIFDQEPILENDRTLVPLRKIFETLGAAVTWDERTQTVTAVKGSKKILLTINSPEMYVNESKITLDVPAQIRNSRTLVPVRAISEALGCRVEWDGASKTVIIND